MEPKEGKHGCSVNPNDFFCRNNNNELGTANNIIMEKHFVKDSPTFSKDLKDKEELDTLSETQMLSKFLYSYCFSNFSSFRTFDVVVSETISKLLSFFKLPSKDFNIKVSMEQLCSELLEYIGKETDTLRNFYKDYVDYIMDDFSSQLSSEIDISASSDIFAIIEKEDILTEEEKEQEKKKEKKEDKILFVEKHMFPYSKELSHICHLSKSLYNHADLLCRMRYYFLLKPARNDLFLNKIYADLWNEWVKKTEFNIFEILSKFKQRVNNHIEMLNKETGRQDYHSIDPDELMDRFGIDKKLVESSFKNREERDKYYKIGQFMNYRELWDMVYYSPEFQAFGGQKGQQTLKILMRNWNSYFKTKAKYDREKKKNPRSDIPKPSIPGYIKKNGEFIVVFPRQSITKLQEVFSKKKTRGTPKHLTEYSFSPKKLNLPNFKTTIPFELIREVCIVPKGNIYIIVVVYKRDKEINSELDKNRFVGCDFGGINLLSIANNFGGRPRIAKGGDIRSANYIAERQVSQLVSNRDDLINSLKKLKKQDRSLYKTDIEKLENAIDELDKQIAPIWIKRYNRVMNTLHQTSRSFVDYCVEYRAGTVALGYNDLWKQTMRMGKKTRKWFNTIPFHTLYKMIKYKAELVGIEVIKVPEFKEDESGKRKGSSQTCSSCGNKGIRVKRGLFRCPHCGLEVNADINSAFNHLKWGREDALDNFAKQLIEIPPLPLTRPLASAE